MEDKKIIKVKCPNCGARLSIEVSPSADLSRGKLTCPNCRVKSPLASFTPVEDKPLRDETQIVANLHDTIGRLLDVGTRKEYQLKEGSQLIGRMTFKEPPKADVPILTDDKMFSRTQFYIRVMKGRDGLYHTYISDFVGKQKNPTYVNGKKLNDDDEDGLKHNDVISAGNTKLRFVGTSFDDETKPFSLANKQKENS